MKKHRVITFILGCLFALTTLPVMYYSFFDYATGDDLGYGWVARQAIVNGEGIPGIVQAAWKNIVEGYYSWQGTWSSIFLFSIEPSIWGERGYILTAWIAVGLLSIGTIYFARKVLGLCGFSRSEIWSVCFVALTLSLQYIPTPRGGIYWYTSVAHYVIPYGISLLVMGWAVQYVKTAGIGYYIGILLAMTYLGGAGYPALVIAAAWVFFVMVIAWQQKVKNARLLILPLTSEAIGLAISAAAPGNKVRGGDEFGFSVSRVLGTFGSSFVEAVKGLGSEFVRSPLLLPLLFVLVVVVYLAGINQDKDNEKAVKVSVPVSVVACLVFSSVVRMPEIYAAVEVSGGVPDTYHFVDLLGICIVCICVARWIWYLIGTKQKAAQHAKLICSILLCAAGLTAVVSIKPVIKNSLDYELYQFAASGRLADFDSQMKERLELLNSDEEDVIVPDMSDEQGPFMHMPLGPDPSEWANTNTANFYGKRSVISVPREEFVK